MVGWRKLSRKRRSEIRWEIAGFLYLLIILPFLAWLANSARLRNFTRFPSWMEIFPAFLISPLVLVAQLSGERRGWVPRERYGDEAFLALYRAYGEIPLDVVERRWPRVGLQALVQAAMDAIAQEVTPNILQQQLGLDPAAFEAEFLKWWKARR